MHLAKYKNDYLIQEKITEILFLDDMQIDGSTFADIEIITKERMKLLR